MSELTLIKQRFGLQWYLLSRGAALHLEAATSLVRARTSPRLRIVIGSSGISENGWIPSNYQYLNLLVAAHWKRTFGNRKIEAVLAKHQEWSAVDNSKLSDWEPSLSEAKSACFRIAWYLRIANRQ